MNRRRYPKGLFIMGFITNLLLRFVWLFVPGVILLIAGIFIRPCLYLGALVLLLDVIVSLTEQIRLRRTFLKESDHPDFRSFQEALSAGGDWKENIQDWFNQRMADQQKISEENTTSNDSHEGC